MISAEGLDGTSGGASGGIGMSVAVVQVWGSWWYWCVGTSMGCLANLAGVSQWYKYGGPGDPARGLAMVSVWGSQWSQQGDPGATSC